MTFIPRQLVQLQRDLKSIEKAGIQIVGISYDSTKVLKTFSDRMSIGFPMLSDPESETIEAYHIRNPAAQGKQGGAISGYVYTRSSGSNPRKAFPRGISGTPHHGGSYQGGKGRELTA